jgi:hypothetical protein
MGNLHKSKISLDHAKIQIAVLICAICGKKTFPSVAAEPLQGYLFL